MLIQELLNGEAICRVLLQTLINEVLEGSTPFRGDSGYGVMNDGVKQLTTLLDRVKWRAACRKLISKAAKGPHVDLFRVLDALSDLRTDPVGSAKLCLSISLLLR